MLVKNWLSSCSRCSSFWHQKTEHENKGSRSKINKLAGMNGQDPLLLGKLASLTHTPQPWRPAPGPLYRQPPRRIGCFFASADSAHHGGMMRVGGGGAEGGMGEGDKVFCSMRFLASIDHGGQGRPTAAMKPHSWLLRIQQSANILCDKLVSLKLEKTIIINVY